MEIDTEAVPEILLDLLKLVETHAAVVDTDRVEAVSNGLAHQSRSHSAIDTATYATNDKSLRTNKFPDASDLELDKVAHLPVWFSSANVDAEVGQDLGSTGSLDSNVRGSSNVSFLGDKRVRVQGETGHLVTLLALFPPNPQIGRQTKDGLLLVSNAGKL